MKERKTLYKSNVEPFFEEIAYWRKDGDSEEVVANKLGIAYSTFKVYKNKYSAFSAVLKKGKESLVMEIEKSLYKRALGYDIEEIKTIIEEDAGGNKKKKIEKNKKHMPPDVGAIVFSLTNLRGDKWKNKQDHNLKGELGVNSSVNLEHMSEDEIKAELTKYEKK